MRKSKYAVFACLHHLVDFALFKTWLRRGSCAEASGRPGAPKVCHIAVDIDKCNLGWALRLLELELDAESARAIASWCVKQIPAIPSFLLVASVHE